MHIKIKDIKLKWIIPLEIVKSLNGKGVKPAVTNIPNHAKNPPPVVNFCLKSYNDLIKPFQGKIGLSRQISFGGVNSFRGFNDNQFKSSALSVQSLEIHYTLDKAFKIITLIDCGFAKDYYPKYSFGFGLSKISKTALIDVQYAVPLGSAIQNGKVHLKWVTRL